jgi:hypothetical protein
MRVVVSGIAGLAIGALVVGLVWLTIGGSAEKDVSSAPIVAPAKAGEYQRFADVPVNQQPAAKTAVENQTNADKESAKLLSASYHGATATVETYASADLDVRIPVYIVRASSPELFTPYTDTKVLQIKAPEHELKKFGDVTCIVQNSFTGNASPDQPTVWASECQRTSATLTVHIPGMSNPLGKQPEQVAAVVDEVFNAVA